MKHIFMGKINYIRWQVSFYSTNKEDYIYNYNLYNLYGINTIDDIPNNIKDIDLRIYTCTYDTKYKLIKESNTIEEKLHEQDKVKINDEELRIEKVIQCDNGDVICYTDKIIQEVEDEESVKNKNTILNEIKKRQAEYNENLKVLKQQKNNKKWYQFWK